MVNEKRLKIIIIICCIFLILKSTVSFEFAFYFSQQQNDWRDIHYELPFLVGSIILVAFWIIALFKDDRCFYLFTSLISIIPIAWAVVGFISVVHNKHYVYEVIFIDVGINGDDIPFYSLLLAFIWIGLCSIPAVTFLRLRSLKSSPVPHPVYAKPDTGLLLPPI